MKTTFPPRSFPLRIRQFTATVGVCTRQVFGAGCLPVIPTNLVRLAECIVLMLLWVGFDKADIPLGGMSLQALLRYTLLSFVLRQQLDIITPATSALWEGSVVGRYIRPMPVFLSYAAETVGRWWVPTWLLFSVPLLLVAPLLGVNTLPVSVARGGLFLLSLVLAIVIGFAIDLLFSAFAIRLRNSVWMATQIRDSVYNLLSGAVLPFALFPAPVGAVLSLLPFGSIASAPLTIYTGGGSPGRLILLQLAWVCILCPLARWCYKKSEERMVSYGG